MDITQIYMASPDWLKLAWLVVPWLTVYGLARLWRDVRLKAPGFQAATDEGRVQPLYLNAADLRALKADDLPELQPGAVPLTSLPGKTAEQGTSSGTAA